MTRKEDLILYKIFSDVDGLLVTGEVESNPKGIGLILNDLHEIVTNHIADFSKCGFQIIMVIEKREAKTE